MQISHNGLNLIKKYEGCKLTAYKDCVGIWTIGWGTTNSDKAITRTTIQSGLKISQETADNWLEQSVNKKYAPLVEKYNSKYHFNQNQFDALVSFAYNIGSIDQLTQNGTRTIEQISCHITAYNKAGKKVLLGLTRRRNEEKKLFDTPIQGSQYDNGQAVEIHVPIKQTGARQEDGKVQVESDTVQNKATGSKQFWIHESVIKNSQIIARATVCYVEGERIMVQIFDELFWINEKEIAKIL